MAQISTDLPSHWDFPRWTQDRNTTAHAVTRSNTDLAIVSPQPLAVQGAWALGEGGIPQYTHQPSHDMINLALCTQIDLATWIPDICHSHSFVSCHRGPLCFFLGFRPDPLGDSVVLMFLEDIMDHEGIRPCDAKRKKMQSSGQLFRACWSSSAEHTPTVLGIA